MPQNYTFEAGLFKFLITQINRRITHNSIFVFHLKSFPLTAYRPPLARSYSNQATNSREPARCFEHLSSCHRNRSFKDQSPTFVAAAFVAGRALYPAFRPSQPLFSKTFAALATHVLARLSGKLTDRPAKHSAFREGPTNIPHPPKPSRGSCNFVFEFP
jgi:hypothetical protein